MILLQYEFFFQTAKLFTFLRTERPSFFEVSCNCTFLSSFILFLCLHFFFFCSCGFII